MTLGIKYDIFVYYSPVVPNCLCWCLIFAGGRYMDASVAIISRLQQSLAPLSWFGIQFSSGFWTSWLTYFLKGSVAWQSHLSPPHPAKDGRRVKLFQVPG